MPVASSEIAPARPIDRFRWSIAAYETAILSAIFIAIEFSKDWDFGGFFFLLLTSPIVALGMLTISAVKAFRRRRRGALSFLLAAVAYCAVSWLLLKFSTELHAEILWAVHSEQYKADVLARSAGANGLKSIYWFGWGWAGSGTDMYLAYDPTDSLSHKDPHTGRFGSLKCDKVWKVHRLQRDWYGVTFDTNEVWEDSCDSPSPSP